MSTNIQEIPFTEIVERVQKLGRFGENTMDKIRGIVNDVAVREIPAKVDWNFLMAESSFLTVQESHTGTVSMNTGDVTVSLSSGTFPSTCVGYKIKFTGNDTVYDVTVYNNATSITINPSLQGNTNLSGAAYSLYQPRYSLAPDFDRFPKPGGVYRWVGGRKQVLEEVQYAKYINDYYSSTASVPSNTRLIGTDTKGCNVVELIPAPRDAKVYGYDYIRFVDPMYQTTAGTITSINANGTIVSASSANFLSVSTDGTFFFRVDNLGTGADSTWYRILSIQNDNQLTLATAFANTSITVANYTISKSPDYPVRLHIGIVYGALRNMLVDQNDPNVAFYHTQYAQVLSDAKKIYMSRPYSQDVTGVFEDYRYRR